MYLEKINCCLLMGTSRVTPKKYKTIPRLELVAAFLSVKIAALIRRVLGIECKDENSGTDRYQKIQNICC